MAVGDEVAKNLEAQVRDAIERMVVDIRSTIQDVREAIDQQLDAALQSVQADANAMSFRSSIQKELATFEESLAPGEAAFPAPVKTGEESGRVRASIQEIEKGRSQVDVLNALLDQCLQYGSRAALMILKGDTFAGWKGAGFAAHGGNDDAVKRFTAAPQTVPELDEILSAEHVVEWDGANLAGRLGVTAPSRAIAIPMVIKDKVSAAVYVDVVGDDDANRLDPSALSVLVFMTGLLIDTLAIRKKVPSPSLNVGTGAATGAAVPARPSTPAPSLPPPPAPKPAAPAPAPAAPAATRLPAGEASGAFRRSSAGDISAVRRPAPAAPPPPPVEEASAPAAFKPTFQLETEVAPAPKPAPAPAPTPLATTAIPAMREDTGSGARPAVTPKPAPPAAPATGASSFAETADRPSTQYIPPPGVARGGAFGGAQSDDARKHDEARRFARLLVSEIKLYNEAKVEQGRKNHDLYERLKEDIDRSRQMYDERITEEVRKQSNYFYEELVRILADGDTNALGL